MDERDLERLRSLYDQVEAPDDPTSPAVDWAREAFDGLRMPSIEAPGTDAEASPARTAVTQAGAALAWARAANERVRAPKHLSAPERTPGATLAVVVSLAGAMLAAAAAALLIVLPSVTRSPDSPNTTLASLPRPVEDVPRTDEPEPGSDPSPVVRLRTDGFELRSGAVRLVVLDPIDED